MQRGKIKLRQDEDNGEAFSIYFSEKFDNARVAQLVESKFSKFGVGDANSLSCSINVPESLGSRPK